MKNVDRFTHIIPKHVGRTSEDFEPEERFEVVRASDYDALNTSYGAMRFIFDGFQSPDYPAALSQFRHYKGGLYLLLFVGRLSEDHTTEVVIYYSQEKQAVWVRPLRSKPGVDAWEDQVVWPDGETRQRFIPVPPAFSISDSQ